MNLFNKSFFSGMKLSQVMLMLLGFSVPISTALDNVLLVLLLIYGLMICGRDALRISYHNPVVQAAMLLFGILLAGSFYGATPLDEAFGTLGKYIDLAMIPLFMAVMRKDQNTGSALDGFLLAMLITLALSYLMNFGILEVQPWMWQRTKDIDSPAIFRHYLTQNTFMALAAFLALLRMREAADVLKRSLWGVFALLGIINVLFMMAGRTGYIILVILLLWLIWSTLTKNLRIQNKSVSLSHGIVVALLSVLVMIGIYQISPRLQTRVDLTISELIAWKPGVRNNTSVGDRMEFYYNALQISRQQPIAGVGTGGFHAAYEKQVQGKNLWVVRNPHNEYLMITVQTGLIGLFLLLYLFYTLWRYAPLLDSTFKQDAARGVVLAMTIDCLFNSPLLDHAPGLLFALMTATFFANLEAEQKRG